MYIVQDRRYSHSCFHFDRCPSALAVEVSAANFQAICFLRKPTCKSDQPQVPEDSPQRPWQTRGESWVVFSWLWVPTGDLRRPHYSRNRVKANVKLLVLVGDLECRLQIPGHGDKDPVLRHNRCRREHRATGLVGFKRRF